MAGVFRVEANRVERRLYITPCLLRVEVGLDNYGSMACRSSSEAGDEG